MTMEVNFGIGMDVSKILAAFQELEDQGKNKLPTALDKATQYVERLEKQLQRGAITQEAFAKKVYQARNEVLRAAEDAEKYQTAQSHQTQATQAAMEAEKRLAQIRQQSLGVTHEIEKANLQLAAVQRGSPATVQELHALEVKRLQTAHALALEKEKDPAVQAALSAQLKQQIVLMETKLRVQQETAAAQARERAPSYSAAPVNFSRAAGEENAAGLNASAAAAETASGKMLGLAKSAGLVYLAYRALKSVVQTLTFPVQEFAKFETQMSQVGVAAGASGAELQQLMTAAQGIGRDLTSTFTQNQAAEGLLVLSRAGKSAQEQIEMIKPALDLAQGGIIALDRGTELLLNTLSLFDLQASQSREVVDRYVQSANASTQDVTDLEYLVTRAGAAFKAAGFREGFNDLTLLGSALADLGMKGERGTDGVQSFAIKLAGLADPSEKQKKIIRELGLSFDEINPALHSVTEIIDVFHDKQISLTQAVGLFEEVGGRTFIELFKRGGVYLDQMNKKIEEAAGAHEAAVKNTGSTALAIQGLSKSTDDLATAVGERLAPAWAKVLNAASQATQAMADAVRVEKPTSESNIARLRREIEASQAVAANVSPFGADLDAAQAWSQLRQKKLELERLLEERFNTAIKEANADPRYQLPTHIPGAKGYEKSVETIHTLTAPKVDLAAQSELKLAQDILALEKQSLTQERAIKQNVSERAQAEYQVALMKAKQVEAIALLKAAGETDSQKSAQAKAEAHGKRQLAEMEAQNRLEEAAREKQREAEKKVLDLRSKGLDHASEMQKKQLELEAALKGQKVQEKDLLDLEYRKLAAHSALRLQQEKDPLVQKEIGQELKQQHQLYQANLRLASARDAQESQDRLAGLEQDRLQTALEFNQRNAELDAMIQGQVVSAQQLLDFELQRLDIALKRAMIEAKGDPKKEEMAKDAREKAEAIARKDTLTREQQQLREKWKPLTDLAAQGFQSLVNPILQKQGASAQPAQQVGAVVGNTVGQQIGTQIGTAIGGTLGSFGGPLGAAAGSAIGSVLFGKLFPGGGAPHQSDKIDDSQFSNTFGKYWSEMWVKLKAPAQQAAEAIRLSFETARNDAKKIGDAWQRLDATMATLSGRTQALAEAGQVVAARASLEEMRSESGVADLTQRRAALEAEIAQAKAVKPKTSTQIVGMEQGRPVYASIEEQQQIDVSGLEEQLAKVNKDFGLLTERLTETSDFVSKTARKLEYDLNTQLDETLAGDTGGVASQVKKLRQEYQGDEWTVGLLTKIKQLGLTAEAEAAMIGKANDAMAASIAKTIGDVATPWGDFLAQDSMGEVGYALHQLDESADKAIASLTKAAQETGVEVAGAVQQITESLARQKQLKREAAAEEITGTLNPYAQAIHSARGDGLEWQVALIEEAGRKALAKAKELAEITGGSQAFAEAVIKQGVAAQVAQVTQERTDKLKGFQNAVARINMTPLQKSLAEFDDQAAEYSRTLASDSEMLAAALASVAAQKNQAIKDSLKPVQEINAKSALGDVMFAVYQIAQKYSDMLKSQAYTAEQVASIVKAQSLEIEQSLKQAFDPLVQAAISFVQNLRDYSKKLSGTDTISLADVQKRLADAQKLPSLVGEVDLSKLKERQNLYHSIYADIQKVEASQREAAQKQTEGMKGLLQLAQSFEQTVRGIKYGKSVVDPAKTLTEAQSEFESLRIRTAAALSAGNVQAAQSLSQELTQFAPQLLEMAQTVYATGAGYRDIQAKVIADLQSIQAQAKGQLESGLNVRNQSLDQLTTLVSQIGQLSPQTITSLTTALEDLAKLGEAIPRDIVQTIDQRFKMDVKFDGLVQNAQGQWIVPSTADLDLSLTGDQLTTANEGYTWTDSVVFNGSATQANGTVQAPFTFSYYGAGTQANGASLASPVATFSYYGAGTQANGASLASPVATFSYYGAGTQANGASLASPVATFSYYGAGTQANGASLASPVATFSYYGKGTQANGTSIDPFAFSFAASASLNNQAVTFNGTSGTITATISAGVNVTDLDSLYRTGLWGGGKSAAGWLEQLHSDMTTMHSYLLTSHSKHDISNEHLNGIKQYGGTNTSFSTYLVGQNSISLVKGMNDMLKADGLPIQTFYSAAGGLWEVPHVGLGVDGRGGVPAFLHAEESVIPAREAGGLRRLVERELMDRPPLRLTDASAVAQTSDPELKRLLKELLEEIRSGNKDRREVGKKLEQMKPIELLDPGASMLAVLKDSQGRARQLARRDG